MPRPVRPLRTVLERPGDREDLVRAAPRSNADCIWIDLEEPRTPFPEAERETVRQWVGAYLREPERATDRQVFVARVQSIESGQTLHDLDAIVGEHLYGVLLPKVRGPEDVVAADALLSNLETEAGLEVGHTLIWPILETADGLRRAYEIAAASARVQYMGGAVSRFGDIVQAIGYRWTQEGTETLYYRSKVLVDSRAAGVLYPMSGMWAGTVDDLEGLRAWAEHLRDIGYRGMMIANEKHVDVVNEVFTPTPEEIAYWQDLVDAADAAERTGSGPITYGDPNSGEGHVVHIAHVGSARLGLEWAHSLGVA